jgi:ABC-2 type transport system permease protein
MRSLLSGSLLVFGRQAREARRDPGPFYVLPMLPALLMTVVFTALFDRISTLDRFGATATTDYVTFLVPGVVVLVALLGAGATSSSVAADLRSGFFERLRLLPVSTASHLIGRLLFEAVRLIPGTAVVLAVGMALGADAPNGIAGMAVVVALVAVLGVAFTGIFYAVAIRTRDPQTPFTLQPLGLPLAFLSSALVPLAVMPGWAEALARLNPVTTVVDAAREAMLGDLWSAELGRAAAVLGAWILLGALLAGTSLNRHTAKG